MSHSHVRDAARVVAEAEAAYVQLRELLATGSADLSAVRACRVRFARTATAAARVTTGRQRLFWEYIACRVARGPRHEVGVRRGAA